MKEKFYLLYEHVEVTVAALAQNNARKYSNHSLVVQSVVIEGIEKL